MAEIRRLRDGRSTTTTSSSAATTGTTMPGPSSSREPTGSTPTTQGQEAGGWQPLHSALTGVGAAILIVVIIIVVVAVLVLLNHKDPVTGRTYFQVRRRDSGGKERENECSILLFRSTASPSSTRPTTRGC